MKLGDPSQARGSAGGAGEKAAGEAGRRSGRLAGGWAAVPGRDQGDLEAEPGRGVLVVADQVLAVALVTLVVRVLAGVGVVLAAGHDAANPAGPAPTTTTS